jgi:recombination protein RecT
MSTTKEPPAPAPTSGAVAHVRREDYLKPTNAAGLAKLAKPLIPQIQAALPRLVAKNAERMVRALMTECEKTPALLECTPISLFGAVLQVSQLGLELGGATGQAYLIPFKKTAQLVIGYKGFVTLAHRSGMVQRITPRVVREGDTFDIQFGTDQRIVHKPAMDQAGLAVGYYAVVELSNGGVDFEYMTKAQAEFHRNRFALSKGGPWANHFDEMAMKTCIRKLAKRLPLSVEWNTAAGLDESAESDGGQNLGAGVILEGAPEAGTPDALRERMERTKAEDTEEPPPEGDMSEWDRQAEAKAAATK